MPTIEIASINATGLNLEQADFEIAIMEETRLISHRSLFYDFLRKMKGVIVHIGSPNQKYGEGPGFYAGGIVDWSFEPGDIYLPISNPNDPKDRQSRFKFLSEYRPDIDKLLKVALEHSPIRKVYFLTDYQFGPVLGAMEIIYTISDLWAQHDEVGLKLNAMYELHDL